MDLAKATLACGAGSFLTFTFPLIGQVVLIGLLSLVWLLYARQVVLQLRRR